MSIEDVGEIPIDQCDDANIPVVCFLSQIKDDTEDDREHIGKWCFSACNFMPRKELVSEDSYRFYADTKEEAIEYVNKYIVPIYEAAIANLKNHGKNYYWKIEQEAKP